MQLHELKENNTGCMSAHDARQCDAINRNNMVGQSFTEQPNKPISSKGSRVGAVIREFAQFILA